MDASRRERKRAVDREAQRISRERTRQHIAHLESLVDYLTSNATDGQSNSLVKRVEEQWGQINELQQTLNSISKLARLAERTVAPTGETRDGGQGSLPQSSSPAEPKYDQQQAYMKAYFGGRSLDCDFAEDDYLSVLSNAFQDAESWLRLHEPTLSIQEEEDLIIRSLLYGWHVVAQQYHLDLGWELLRALDEGILCRSGFVERCAAIRLLRSTMLAKRSDMMVESESLPNFMKKSIAQSAFSHEGMIDYFAWPSIRDRFILNGFEGITAQSIALFARSIKFQWEYEARDVYHRHQLGDMLVFSDLFKRHYNDLSCWRMHPSFTTELQTTRNLQKQSRTYYALGTDQISITQNTSNCTVEGSDLPHDHT